MPQAKQAVCIIGPGAWGTALATQLVRSGVQVNLYGPDAELRTVLSLSLRGRPHCFMSKAVAGPGSASASGPIPKSEPFNVVPRTPLDSAPGAASASPTVGDSAPLNVTPAAPCDGAPGSTNERTCQTID